MGRWLRRLRRDERGVSFVVVGMGFMAFLAATTLAIDVGMFMTARSQSQNAADAGALAGAVALAFDNYEDRSASGPSVRNALAAATANQVIGRDVSITPSDVTFPNDPQGRPTRVRVQVFRTGARGNPLATLMGTMFGVATADVGADATGEAAPANAMTCVKPFTLPDKWIERQTPPWDPDDTYDAYDRRGNPLPNPDIYIPADQPDFTGYNPERDRGLRLMIRAGTGNNITPSFYFSWAIGTDTGADRYRWNIANCNTTIVRWGERITQEPGNMVGPTNQGIDELIARDPNAYWDTSANRPVSTSNPSPRVVGIPMYDPPYYDSGKRNGRNADLRVANFIGFFVEERRGNNVYGRLTPIGAIIDGTSTLNTFARGIRLVE